MAALSVGFSAGPLSLHVTKLYRRDPPQTLPGTPAGGRGRAPRVRTYTTGPAHAPGRSSVFPPRRRVTPGTETGTGGPVSPAP